MTLPRKLSGLFMPAQRPAAASIMTTMHPPPNGVVLVRMSSWNLLYFICRQIVGTLGAIRTRFSRSWPVCSGSSSARFLLRFFGSRRIGKQLILGFWLREVAFPLSQALAGNQGLHAPGWLPKGVRQGQGAPGGSSQGPYSLSSPSPRGGS